MNVLIACEFSGRVRDAFLLMGHNAVSCDLIPSESPGPHYQGDVRDLLSEKWDLLIAHPPCTYLASSGARWFNQPGRREKQQEAIAFAKVILSAPIQKIAMENPVGILSSEIRKPDQYIQPWQFGDGVTKKTCLWLKNLPPLQPSNIVSGRKPEVHHEPPGPDRWKNRSRTYPGIAAAMAAQWGCQNTLRGEKR